MSSQKIYILRIVAQHDFGATLSRTAHTTRAGAEEWARDHLLPYLRSQEAEEWQKYIEEEITEIDLIS